MNISTDRALIPADHIAVRYLSVTITAPTREGRHERPSVHVALVLDRSGSMAGRKIEMAKKAADHAVRLLNEHDRLAVVSYDTAVDTLLGATAATGEAKKLALTRLSAIDARGGTDLCAGWLRGAEELGSGATPAADTAFDASLRRVLLLSDGQANEGETNHDVLARRAAELRAKGIATSTFGLGADFDEVLMSRLATEGGGHFYFIEQPAQIPDILTSELGEALEVVARDARLVVAGGPGVDVACLNPFPADVQAGADGPEMHIRLGDLVSAQELTLILAVRCPAGSVGDAARTTLRLSDRDHALFAQPLTMDWRVAEEAANAGQAVSADVLIEVATLLAERAKAAALEANRRGDYADASALLKAAAVELRMLGAGIRQIEALAAELEAEQADFTAVMPAMAMKSRHFANLSRMASRSVEGKARKRTHS